MELNKNFNKINFLIKLERDLHFCVPSKTVHIPKADQKGLQSGKLGFFNIFISAHDISLYFPSIILPTSEKGLDSEFHYLLESHLLPRVIRYISDVEAQRLTTWMI